MPQVEHLPNVVDIVFVIAVDHAYPFEPTGVHAAAKRCAVSAIGFVMYHTDDTRMFTSELLRLVRRSISRPIVYYDDLERQSVRFEHRKCTLRYRSHRSPVVVYRKKQAHAFRQLQPFANAATLLAFARLE